MDDITVSITDLAFQFVLAAMRSNTSHPDVRFAAAEFGIYVQHMPQHQLDALSAAALDAAIAGADRG